MEIQVIVMGPQFTKTTRYRLIQVQAKILSPVRISGETVSSKFRPSKSWISNSRCGQPLSWLYNLPGFVFVGIKSHLTRAVDVFHSHSYETSSDQGAALCGL